MWRLAERRKNAERKVVKKIYGLLLAMVKQVQQPNIQVIQGIEGNQEYMILKTKMGVSRVEDEGRKGT